MHSLAFHEAAGDERLQRQHGGALCKSFIPQLLADVVTGCAVAAGGPVPGECCERRNLAPVQIQCLLHVRHMARG